MTGAPKIISISLVIEYIWLETDGTRIAILQMATIEDYLNLQRQKRAATPVNPKLNSKTDGPSKSYD